MPANHPSGDRPSNDRPSGDGLSDHRPSGDKPAIPVIAAGLFCRCPRCGRGRLFDGYLKLAPACSVCGLSFEGSDTADGPAFFIILPLSVITCVLALVVDVKLQPPMWVHMVVWPLFIALTVGFTLRPVKAIMVALQYRYRDVEKSPGLDGQ